MLLTQTNWLKMPAREPGSSLDAQNGAHHVGTTLLKRHKILPHPRENRNSGVFSISAVPNLPDTASVDSELASIPTSETSSPRVLKHKSKRRIGAPGLPPTPPAHSRQSSETQSIVVPPPKIELTSVNDALSVSTPSTPPIQKSPPTPDVTPPRAMPPLTSRPTINSRYPSSRADSFRTAPETPYASDADDDESSTVRPKLPSTRISESEVSQSEGRSVKRKEVGLGLGLESDGEGSATPKPKPVISRDEFVVFDGEWASHSNDDVSEVEREWDDNLMRNVTVRKNRHKDQQDEVVEDDVILPTQATKAVRKLPLHEGAGHRRLKRDITEPTAKSGTWPRMAKDVDSPVVPDTRRFSTMSGRSTTSTVVEAMVVDAPAQRRRTLRHTKKQFGLRDFGSDQSTMSSAPPSEVSSVRRHRLVHRDDRIPERRDQSLASNATLSTTSSKSRRKVIREGGIPVVVIPDRISSAHDSKPPSLRSTSSRKTKRSMSLRSAPLSQSSKFNEPGYFDARPQIKRTMSESAGSSNSVRTIDYPPSIPTRKSSLSAPTSRNTSRAGSLTAESLKAHNAFQEKQKSKPEPVKILRPSSSEKDPEPHSARLNVDHNGDPFFSNRRSTQVTPFSQASYETTGTIGTTAEISQAMAVSIFPHQNKSWRVIHKQLESEPHIAAGKAESESEPEPEPQPLALRRLITHQPVVELNVQNMDDPLTPAQPTHTSDGVDSPLRNPRAPPEPPAIKFIPPTPSELSPGAYAERQLGFDFNTRLDEDFDDRPSTSDRPRRAFSIRRALSNRRYSEVIIPESGLLSRAFSLSARRKDMSTQTSKPEANPTTHYPSVLDQPADDSKLHPFWRPANFWDDLEDNDSDEEDDFPETYVSSGHRPAAPKRSFSGRLKRTFAILPLSYNNEYYEVPIDRKTMRRSPSGNLRVVKQRSNNTLRREARERQFYEPKEGEFGHGFKEGNRGRIHTIPGLGLRIEYVGLKGLGKKISERRKEQRNARLRATISSPRGLRNGVDDVLESKRNVI